MSEIRALDASLVAICPQIVEQSREFAEQKQFTFDILSDVGNQVAQQFGLVHTLPEDVKKIYQSLGINLPAFNGDDSWSLPIPARYIIDRDCRIDYAEASPNYTLRPEPSETVAALKTLSERSPGGR